MRKNKGCSNESCQAYKKKRNYKETESFCSICGSPLVYVCKKCYKQLPTASENYCVRCNAENDDDTNKLIKLGGGVIGGGVITSILSKISGKNPIDGAKKAIDIIKNIKS